MNLINLLSISNVCRNFNTFSKIGKGIIAVLVFVCFLYLSVYSVLGTTTFENYKNGYTFSYEYDNIIVNVICMILTIIFIYTFFNDIISKINPRWFSAILSIYVLVLGIFWIVSTKTIPTSDCYNIVDTAVTVSNGDYDTWLNIESKNYYYRYPYQLGFVLWCQIFVSIFKESYIVALQVANVVCLIALYLAIIKIVHRTLNNIKITNYTILLFFFCIQGIMFTTLIYGILSGFAFGIWAVYFVIEYIKTNRKRYIIPCSILLGISVILKLNDMIIMIAICIVLLLKFLDTRKLFDIVAIILCFMIGNNLIDVVVYGYEFKAGVDFGDGMPWIVYANIGLHESNPYYDNTYGWYNRKYSNDIFISNDYDKRITAEIAKEQILEQIEYFKSNTDYANMFFTEKILSQWNEPTYASIWVSERCEHSGDISKFVESMYYGANHEYALFISNQYQQIIFCLSCIFLGTLFKKRDVSLYIFPLIVLGGFFYHIVFEAKSQYVFTYFILLIPMAGYGLNYILSHRFFDIIKSIPKKFSST